MRYFKTGKVFDNKTITFYVTEGNKKDCDIVHEGIRQAEFENCTILYREQTTKKLIYLESSSLSLLVLVPRG